MPTRRTPRARRSAWRGFRRRPSYAPGGASRARPVRSRPGGIRRADSRRMNIDLTAAANFMATHARLLDRRRFEGDRGGALAALDGYRNGDGGYGWGLEPDLRAHESQPGSAHHAFEV